MSNKIISTCIITTVLYVLQLSPSIAGVYRWVDQDGQVHYGDKPGKEDAKKVPIRQHLTTTPRAINKTDNEGNEKSLGTSQKNQKNDKMNKQPSAAQKPGISQKEKNRLCNEARNDVAAINSRGRMREKNAKGEYRYLSENERQKRLAAARKKQRKYCR